MSNNITNQRFIKVEFKARASMEQMFELKKMFENAAHLIPKGKVVTTKDTSARGWVHLEIQFPHKGELTPKEFDESADALFALANKLSDMENAHLLAEGEVRARKEWKNYVGKNYGIFLNLTEAVRKEEVFFERIHTRFFFIKIPFLELSDLADEHPDIAEDIIGRGFWSLMEELAPNRSWFSRLFTSKPTLAIEQKRKERLLEWFNVEV